MQIFKQITANNITLEEFKFRMELAMEAYLIENETILKLDNIEFNEVEIIDAEVALTAGRKSKGKDGRIDLLVKYGSEYLGIVELKLDQLCEKHLTQLEDYLQQRNQLLVKFPHFWGEEDGGIEPKWIGVLVGNSADKVLIEKISNGYKFDNTIPIAIILLNRFRNTANNEIYVISDTIFKNNIVARDYSKFKLNNVIYNKGKLVNAAVKEYVSLNPQMTFSELERVFPKTMQGSLGVFCTKLDAEAIYHRTNRKRHHIKPEEVINLRDSLIATCSQWNSVNIQSFITQVNKIEPKIKIELI